jgi:hypothetical protein
MGAREIGTREIGQIRGERGQVGPIAVQRLVKVGQHYRAFRMCFPVIRQGQVSCGRSSRTRCICSL